MKRMMLIRPAALLAVLVLLLAAVLPAAAASPTLTLNPKSLTVNRGRIVPVTPVLKGGSSEGVTYTWSTADASVATVDRGRVKGVNPGETTVTCVALLSDGTSLRARCTVTVIVPVTEIKAEKKTLTVGVGRRVKPVFTVRPTNASDKTYTLSTSDAKVVKVDGDRIVGIAPGKAVITATANDGSGRLARVSVTVPRLSAPTALTFRTPEEATVVIHCYGGLKAEDLTWQKNGAAVDFRTVVIDKEKQTLTLGLIPERAGRVTVTVAHKRLDERVKITVDVEHSAVYDEVSYPPLNYMRAVEGKVKEGTQVSLTGTVLEITPVEEGTVYRISLNNRRNSVVRVFEPSSNMGIPLWEEDVVTVYGTVTGTARVRSVNGKTTTTAPDIAAVRIDLQ